MNLSRSSFHVILSKHLFKTHLPQPRALKCRNLSQFRRLMIFDGRGGVLDKTNANSGFMNSSSPSVYVSPVPVVCNCSEVCRNKICFANFHTTSGNFHGEYEWQDPKSEEEVVNIQITDKEGKINNVRGKIGDNLLYLAKRFEVEMEGACEASLACTTCHVYVDHDFLDLLPESTETEEDLLDQAPFLKENSRLGCQIILSKQLEGIKLSLPAATKNFYVDGHKPTPH